MMRISCDKFDFTSYDAFGRSMIKVWYKFATGAAIKWVCGSTASTVDSTSLACQCHSTFNYASSWVLLEAMKQWKLKTDCETTR
jgi:hypothetical protein